MKRKKISIDIDIKEVWFDEQESERLSQGTDKEIAEVWNKIIYSSGLTPPPSREEIKTRLVDMKEKREIDKARSEPEDTADTLRNQ